MTIFAALWGPLVPNHVSVKAKNFRVCLMKYFVYFDAYGHAGQIIGEQELAEKFNNEPAEFLSAMSRERSGGIPTGHTTGHVGTFSFDSRKELLDYLESLGDEITGFYGCRSESRPYNF